MKEWRATSMRLSSSEEEGGSSWRESKSKKRRDGGERSREYKKVAYARQGDFFSSKIQSASSMGRSLIPILCGELANLEKDVESRKSAMKALKSYVRDLDAREIPVFLAQLSERKGPGQTDEYTITLYEILARVHGHNIVPHIDNIMSTIVTTLKSSAGSFTLHQACSKVVPAIAKHGIDPSIPGGEKAEIIRSLCSPLCDILTGPSETVAAGAALCLKALVESDGWQFAPDDVVNDICCELWRLWRRS
ncbi:Gem-associated protein 2 [Cinnamomum micranthum f. kanehirae]|uniref:Gem-associated protein 2 n=1 Tax=Cinnamomum micranthum f. kanehirae TaxID=337451 RepID=A0A3S3MQ26_9MAGN|nr:Gem-associated protein 2 [Cinnamomum micranthum f. kanehirae]